MNWADAPDPDDDLWDSVDFWAEQLDEEPDDETLVNVAQLATQVAVLAFLDIASDAWDALDQAETAVAEPDTEQLDDAWGDDGYSNEMIADTNALSQFSDGQASNSEDADFWQYIGEDDACEEICADLIGTILPPDDDWWAEFTPPNHIRCACGWVPLTAAEAGMRGGPDDAGPVTQVQEGFGRDRWVPDLSTRPDVLAGIASLKIQEAA